MKEKEDRLTSLNMTSSEISNQYMETPCIILTPMSDRKAVPFSYWSTNSDQCMKKAAEEPTAVEDYLHQ